MHLLIMKNKWYIIASCAVLLLAAGCKNSTSDPFADPGDIENPHWVLTVDNDMTNSMTAIVHVSFAQQEGTLAAFTGNDCCGVAEYIDGLYFLYVSPANEEGGEVQLRFYSPRLKRIFVATETIPFHSHDIIGSVSHPHTPDWKVAQ